MPCTLIRDIDTAATVPLTDRGLHFGDGLFETLLWRGGHPICWQEHYQRLQADAARLNIDCPSDSFLLNALLDYPDQQQDYVFKIILTRAGRERGLQAPSTTGSTAYILRYNYKKPTNQSVKINVSSILLPKDSILSGIKHLNRLHYVLATDDLARHPAYDESVLVDEDANLVECITHNLFFVKNHIVHTPSLDHAGVCGIMRKKIIDHLHTAATEIRIGRYNVPDLLAANECFICNSVQGIRPVTAINEQTFKVGTTTRSLQELLNDS